MSSQSFSECHKKYIIEPEITRESLAKQSDCFCQASLKGEIMAA